MSSSWVVCGTGAPLNADMEEIVRQFLSANWGASVIPPKEDIKFTTDWFADDRDYTISCQDSRVLPGKRTVGQGSPREYIAFVDVHIFVRQLTELQSEHVGNIQREIDRILNIEDISSIQAGITSVNFRNFREAAVPVHEMARYELHMQHLWHSIATVEIRYWLGKITV